MVRLKFGSKVIKSSDNTLPNIRHKFGSIIADKQNMVDTCVKHKMPPYHNVGKWKCLVNLPVTKSLNWLKLHMWHHSLKTDGDRVEGWTCDWRVFGPSPSRSGGTIFFSRVKFLCWLLFLYPFHPCVMPVACKWSRSFCQNCGWQVAIFKVKVSVRVYMNNVWLFLLDLLS